MTELFHVLQACSTFPTRHLWCLSWQVTSPSLESIRDIIQSIISLYYSEIEVPNSFWLWFFSSSEFSNWSKGNQYWDDFHWFLWVIQEQSLFESTASHCDWVEREAQWHWQKGTTPELSFLWQGTWLWLRLLTLVSQWLCLNMVLLTVVNNTKHAVATMLFSDFGS